MPPACAKWALRISRATPCDAWRDWHANATNAAQLSETLAREHDRALLFRTLATLRSDLPLFTSVDDLQWTGPTPAFEAMAKRLETAKKPPAPDAKK